MWDEADNFRFLDAMSDSLLSGFVVKKLEKEFEKIPNVKDPWYYFRVSGS